MKIHSTETHKRTHAYTLSQDELQRLALEKVGSELGLDLSDKYITVESVLSAQSNGINPTTYSCRVLITESLDCKD